VGLLTVSPHSIFNKKFNFISKSVFFFSCFVLFFLNFLLIKLIFFKKKGGEGDGYHLLINYLNFS
jgi:hypothetical protein